MTSRVTYNVEKIDTGYLVRYYFDGDEVIKAFDNWKSTLDFLKENPPKIFERFETTDYVEIE